MTHALTGMVPVRNGNSLDYCWQQAVESLLPVCEYVIIGDSDSDDGTREEAEAMAAANPKISVVNYQWPNPKGDVWMLKKWLNDIRKHVRTAMQIALDADEVLHPASYQEVRRATIDGGSRLFRRHNFWKSPSLLIPNGQVCGRFVVRMGRAEYAMVSDNCEPSPEPELIRQHARHHPSLQICHYGFLRKPAAFFAKSKVMQQAVCNSYDPRLAEAERTGQPWYTLSNANMKLEPYAGTHPDFMKPWLRERGYAV